MKNNVCYTVGSAEVQLESWNLQKFVSHVTRIAPDVAAETRLSTWTSLTLVSDNCVLLDDIVVVSQTRIVFSATEHCRFCSVL